MSNTAKFTFVIGGARSGKSRYAESLITAQPPPWAYIATAQAIDEEMTARIAAHRARRTADWTTVEAPHDLAAALQACTDRPVLVDCLTLWLSNLMLANADLEAQMMNLEAVLPKITGPLVVVSNEVGAGIVPDHRLGRRFRDVQGVLNQRMAACADRVIFTVAGLPLVLKGAL